MKNGKLILISSVFVVAFCLLIAFARWQNLKTSRPDFLVDGEWQTADGDKIGIAFDKDGKFNFESESGNGLEDFNGYNEYSYNGRFDRIELSGERADSFVEVIYNDRHSLCLKTKNGVRIFKNLNSPIEDAVADSVKGMADFDNSIGLHFLDYKDGCILVAPFDYDGDAKKEYDEYLTELKLADNVKLTSVSVWIENGREDVSVLELGEDDRKNIGEYYTGGYLFFDGYGYVKEVLFYGSTEIQ